MISSQNGDIASLTENSTDVKNPIEGVWYIKNGRNVTVAINRTLTQDFNLHIPVPQRWFFVILRNDTTGKPVQLWINGTNTSTFNAVNFVEGDLYSGTFSYISQS